MQSHLTHRQEKAEGSFSTYYRSRLDCMDMGIFDIPSNEGDYWVDEDGNLYRAVGERGRKRRTTNQRFQYSCCDESDSFKSNELGYRFVMLMRKLNAAIDRTVFRVTGGTVKGHRNDIRVFLITALDAYIHDKYFWRRAHDFARNNGGIINASFRYSESRNSFSVRKRVVIVWPLSDNELHSDSLHTKIVSLSGALCGALRLGVCTVGRGGNVGSTVS